MKTYRIMYMSFNPNNLWFNWPIFRRPWVWRTYQVSKFISNCVTRSHVILSSPGELMQCLILFSVISYKISWHYIEWS